MKILTPASVQTVSQPHWKYCGWPTLIRRRSGELVAVYSGGRNHHVCPFGQIHLIRSADDGTTWSEPLVIADGPLDDRGAGILETATGALLVKFFITSKWEEDLASIEKGAPTMVSDEELIHWRARRDQIDEHIHLSRIGCWAVRSTDDGRSWSKPVRTPVLNAHGPCQLDDGRILYPGKVGLVDAIGMELTPFPESLPFGVAESDDDGQSWRMLCDIPRPEGGKFTEPHAVQAADGRILMHIRYEVERTPEEIRADPEQQIADRARRFVWQTESFDGGRTWSAPAETSIFGYPSHLLLLNDGRLLTSYSHRLEPISIQLRISDDHGASWSDAAIMHHNPECTGDMGYPSTVQLDDGWLLTMWYERLKGETRAVLKTARWRLEDLA